MINLLFVLFSVAHADVAACDAALSTTPAFTRAQAEVIVRVARSAAYGVRLYEKTVDGTRRTLVVVREDPFKTEPNSELGLELLGHDWPTLGDAERLPGLPARGVNGVLLRLNQFATPWGLPFAFGKRRHRLAEDTDRDVELKYEPSGWGRTGYAFDVAKRALSWVAQIATLAVLADALFIKHFGDGLDMGVIEYVRQFTQVIEWRMVAVPIAATIVYDSERLAKLYPPLVFKGERARAIGRQIEATWRGPDAPSRAVFVGGPLGAHALGWELMHRRGYRSVPLDEVFKLVEGADAGRAARWRRRGERAIEAWMRFREKRLPRELCLTDVAAACGKLVVH